MIYCVMHKMCRRKSYSNFVEVFSNFIYRAVFTSQEIVCTMPAEVRVG